MPIQLRLNAAAPAIAIVCRPTSAGKRTAGSARRARIRTTSVVQVTIAIAPTYGAHAVSNIVEWRSDVAQHVEHDVPHGRHGREVGEHRGLRRCVIVVEVAGECRGTRDAPHQRDGAARWRVAASQMPAGCTSHRISPAPNEYVAHTAHAIARAEGRHARRCRRRRDKIVISDASVPISTWICQPHVQFSHWTGEKTSRESAGSNQNGAPPRAPNARAEVGPEHADDAGAEEHVDRDFPTQCSSPTVEPAAASSRPARADGARCAAARDRGT